MPDAQRAHVTSPRIAGSRRSQSAVISPGNFFRRFPKCLRAAAARRARLRGPRRTRPAAPDCETRDRRFHARGEVYHRPSPRAASPPLPRRPSSSAYPGLWRRGSPRRSARDRLPCAPRSLFRAGAERPRRSWDGALVPVDVLRVLQHGVGHHPLAAVEPLEEAGMPPRVARDAARLLDFEQYRVLVAVEPYRFHFLHVPGVLA